MTPVLLRQFEMYAASEGERVAGEVVRVMSAHFLLLVHLRCIYSRLEGVAAR